MTRWTTALDPNLTENDVFIMLADGLMGELYAFGADHPCYYDIQELLVLDFRYRRQLFQGTLEDWLDTIPDAYKTEMYIVQAVP